MKNGPSWVNPARALKVWVGGAILGMVVGCQIIGPFPPSAKIPPAAEGQFRLMGEAWNTIQEVYVGRKTVDSQRITYGAIG
jgi:hypothetical protein